MNTCNTYTVFFILGFCWIPDSYNAMEKSNPLISDQGTNFLAMVKSNPSFQSYRLQRLGEEYDTSMQDIFAHAMLKPYSVLPSSFCVSRDAYALIVPTEGLPRLSWPEQNLSCSYCCSVCTMKFCNSAEFNTHLIHCFPKDGTHA